MAVNTANNISDGIIWLVTCTQVDCTSLWSLVIDELLNHGIAKSVIYQQRYIFLQYLLQNENSPLTYNVFACQFFVEFCQFLVTLKNDFCNFSFVNFYNILCTWPQLVVCGMRFLQQCHKDILPSPMHLNSTTMPDNKMINMLKWVRIWLWVSSIVCIN